jgi:hypothetical protein
MDLSKIMALMAYAQLVEDQVSAHLEATIDEETLALLVQIECEAANN